MMQQELILVSEDDEVLGTMEKMLVHQMGLLHRAFSIFIFNSKGEMLLQQRAETKYHGGGLWTNACCSHPYPNETVEDAATRRLGEELGFSTPLKKAFAFTYKAQVENGLIEHEYDHVFIGEYEGVIIPNKHEVSDYVYKSIADIQQEMIGRPNHFTTWFKLAFPAVETWWQQHYKEKQA